MARTLEQPSVITAATGTRKHEQQVEQQDAIEQLRAMLPPGSTASTILRTASRSGMSRTISVVVPGPDGIHDITWLVARAMGERLTDANGHRAIKVGGCGMDMGFHLVYSLSRVLYPAGHNCTGSDGYTKTLDAEGNRAYNRSKTPRCPSNDHSNGDRAYSRTKTHSDGGYAVSQRWL